MLKDGHLALSHKKEFSLIFSMSTEGFEPVFLKTRLLRSFHISHTQANQITLKTECVLRGIPAIKENWKKCCRSWQGDTVNKPTYFRTSNQTLLGIPHSKKRWVAGSLLRRRCHTNRDTFVGMYQCQTSSTRLLSTCSPEVINW